MGNDKYTTAMAIIEDGLSIIWPEIAFLIMRSKGPVSRNSAMIKNSSAAIKANTFSVE
jgi:hypothetical protein